jgi:broad specificity phosphatase PhoE
VSARHVLLLRHGLTDANSANVIQGHTDVPLNVVGRGQAEQLARRIVAFEPKVDVIVSSDLSRAAETARPIAAACGVPIHWDPAWRERAFGPLEGRQVTPDRIWRIVTGEEEPEGAEGSEAFTERVRRVLASTIERYDGVVAVVSHGGPIRTVLRILGQPLASIANCSILHLEIESGRTVVRCVNDVSHLQERTEKDAG